MIYTLTANPALDLELTVTQIKLGEIHRALAERVDIGGKGFNVSRVLKALGVENIALGFIAGATGARLEKGLKDCGIMTDLVTVAGETRTNVSIVGSGPGDYLKVNQAGARIGAEDAGCMLKEIGKITQPGDLWVLSGSLPPGAPEDFYLQVIERVRGAGGQVILDTSGPALENACRSGVMLLKPNAEEAAELTREGVESFEDARRAARKINSWGVKAVVISMGGQGAVGVDSSGCWVVTPPRIELKNPVGAGDALVAGLAAGITQGMVLAEALRLGTACGASAASRPGTGVGSREEILALLPQVVVTAMD
jgi:1-phosphofructokinase family hexose kinase